MSERHTMRRIREVLRLKFEQNLTGRDIAAAVGISKSAVFEFIRRAKAAGLTWERAQGMSDSEVEMMLFKSIGKHEPKPRAPIDFGWVHRELPRKGVTLQLLWEEYCQGVLQSGGVQPYRYSQFCDLYRGYRAKLSPTMRQIHRAGEKAFVDYSGKKPKIVDAKTGEVREVEFFVMVLGASNYTYAEATYTQQSNDFITATVNAFEYFGCVPEIIVPDQLRSAVSKPHRWDPEINPAYAEMARHYGIAIVPARPRKPKDKSKVEVGVQIAQRWILACLRNRTFFSLDELNQAIMELLERLNARPFQKLEGCRHSAFEKIDKPAMKPLPSKRFVPADWKRAKVNIDYHVDYDGRLYSVPCALIGAHVEVRATPMSIEIFYQSQRVSAHLRSHGPKGSVITADDHRPRNHREYGQWPPSRVIAWASSIGPSAGRLVEQLLQRKKHPEQSYRAALGLFREARKYGNERFETACVRALEIGAPTLHSVRAILEKGLDRQKPESESNRIVVTHDNIRGSTYFDREDLH